MRRKLERCQNYLFNNNIKACIDELSQAHLAEEFQIRLNIISGSFAESERAKRLFLRTTEELNVDRARILNHLTQLIIDISNAEDQKIMIVFIGYNTPGMQVLNIENEYSLIQAAVQHSMYYRLHETIISSIRELHTLLAANGDFLIHFSCHGNLGGLYLSNGNQEPKHTNNESICNFFTPFKQRVKGVIFNACLSRSLGRQLGLQLKTIAMKSEVRDNTCMIYTQNFYHYIFSREHFNEATEYKQAHNYVVNLLNYEDNIDTNIIEYNEPLNL